MLEFINCFECNRYSYELTRDELLLEIYGNGYTYT